MSFTMHLIINMKLGQTHLRDGVVASPPRNQVSDHVFHVVDYRIGLHMNIARKQYAS